MSNLQPDSFRPTGWDTGRENIPIWKFALFKWSSSEGEEYTIADNKFLGNKKGTPLDYTGGIHVYFQ